MQDSLGSVPPLDTVLMVSTPENVAFDFRIAGPFPRFFALVIDLVILGLVLILVTFALGTLGTAGIGLALIIMFFGWWGYGSLLEAFFNGQTVGKRCLGIRVVTIEGLAINPGQAFLRNILRSGDLIPPFFPGVFAMLISSRFQRLGDLAAETIVVMDGTATAPRPPVPPHGSDLIREMIPARFRADGLLVEALAGYVARRGDLSVPRRRELASTLARHFIQVWNLPADTDPDMILCALYDRATRDGAPDLTVPEIALANKI